LNFPEPPPKCSLICSSGTTSLSGNRHWEDSKFHTLLGERVKIHPYTESFGLENVFSIFSQQFIHCHHNIHTQNVLGVRKPKWHSYYTSQLTVTVTIVEYEVAV
jgi:hypothetical protein